MKLHKSLIRLLIPAVILSTVFFHKCADVPRGNDADRKADNYNEIYADKMITAFSFVNPTNSGVISEADNTIIVYVLYGTDVSSLAAEFTTNAESVTIYGREQRSGITVNDFTEQLIYTVTALDGSSREYAVSVEFAVIALFSVTDPACGDTVNGTIDYTQSTISVDLPYYMVISNLAANFDAVGEVTIDSILQTSGITVNDFTDSNTEPLVYEVADENGVSQEYSVTVNYKEVTAGHFAGSIGGLGSSDGAGSFASFRSPYGITADLHNMDVLYVVDQMNYTIRKVEINTRNVTTIAGYPGESGSEDGIGNAARFKWPYGITTDGDNLYVTDFNDYTIRKIVISTGAVTTFAGSPGEQDLMDGSGDGTGTDARFFQPMGITTDLINLYVCDGFSIRQIEISTGEVNIYAGDFMEPNCVDGTGTAARFEGPRDITTDGTYLYVCDLNSIRKIEIDTSEVITIAGNISWQQGFIDDLVDFTDADSNGIPDDPGTDLTAEFYYPSGIITDGGNNLYVTDSLNNSIRQIVIATGVVTTIAGSVPPASISGHTDAFGNTARFNYPQGITINGANTHLFVSDSSNNTIRTISLDTKQVITLAGAVSEQGSTDGTGIEASFKHPEGITSDGTYLYVADTYNYRIRRIVISGDDAGKVTTFAGTGTAGYDDGDGLTVATFTSPKCITTDGTNLYVGDDNKVRQIVISGTDAGKVSTLAGTGAGGHDDGEGLTEATFAGLYGITIDDGNLYAADRYSQRIRKIIIDTGYVSTVAGTGGAVFSDGDGLTQATFSSPQGITTDGTNLYVADTGNNRIRKIVIATGIVSTFAGTGTAGYDDDPNGFNDIDPDELPVRDSAFSGPYGITCDGSNLYSADSGNHLIRKIVISTGVVTILAGIPALKGCSDGAGLNAMFNQPASIIFNDNDKKLYICDEYNNAIRVINP